jgi:hypothetical protein
MCLACRKTERCQQFIRELQQPFTRWFNRTRPVRRHGSLWGGRFKNTILENGLAVWDCWKYIEMNPVIGSDIFVINTVAKARGSLALAKRKLTHASDSPAAMPRLCSFNQLRKLVT